MAFAAFVQPHARLSDAAAFLLGNAGAVVGDGQHQPPRIRGVERRGCLHHAARMLRSIVEQVAEQFVEILRFDRRNRIAADVAGDRQTTHPVQPPDRLHQIRDRGPHRGAGARIDHTGTGAGEVMADRRVDPLDLRGPLRICAEPQRQRRDRRLQRMGERAH
ncbi:hypothetical protein WR25_04553 [Diploscapter pachys]|uniref:Uncharacterized protein n=1 Tax=Diploscapter pachys TaxID=2018661 RepID=A0A2A2M4J8_9BILA|nr:hypothetical protein WR25_04553 [Diploscapter pachys]